MKTVRYELEVLDSGRWVTWDRIRDRKTLERVRVNRANLYPWAKTRKVEITTETKTKVIK